MAGLTAEQIHDYFYNQATGTGGLQDAQAELQDLANSYPDRAASTQRMLDKIRACWTGDASDLAGQGLAPIAEGLLAHGEALTTAQDGVSQQAQAWHTTKNAIQQVPPSPSPVDYAKAAGTAILTGGTSAIPQGVSMVKQVMNHDSVSQANVDAYNSYNGTTDTNTGGMPTLTPLPASNSAPLTISVPAAAAPAAPSGGQAATGSVGTTHSSGGSGHGGASAAPASAPAAPSPAASGPAVPPPLGGTTTSGATAPTVPTVPTAPVGSTPVGGGAGVGAAGVAAGLGAVDDLPGYVPGSISNILSGGSSAEPGFSGALDEPGGGSAGGRPGGVGSGSGAGSGTGGGARSGARAVSEPTAAAVREGGALAGEKAGATGGAMGGTGARGTGKDEDAEHKRKYQYGFDPKDYENDELTAPDVIGETEAHRRARIEATERGETRLD